LNPQAISIDGPGCAHHPRAGPLNTDGVARAVREFKPRWRPAPGWFPQDLVGSAIGNKVATNVWAKAMAYFNGAGKM
jgi:hypothetical protein